MYKACYHAEPPQSYLDRIRLSICVPRGILIFVSDSVTPDLWWLDAAGKGIYTSIRTARAILYLLSQCEECSIVAVDTTGNPQYSRFYKRLGLQEIRRDIWALRMR